MVKIVNTNEAAFKYARDRVQFGQPISKFQALQFKRVDMLTISRTAGSGGNLLDEEGRGFKYMMAKLARERLEVCVKCQAMAEECLKEALSYAKVREAFGRTIGSFQHNAFKLAEIATEVDLGRTCLNTLAAEYIRGDDRATMGKLAGSGWRSASSVRPWLRNA